jgi:hypothetical protein
MDSDAVIFGDFRSRSDTPFGRDKLRFDAEAVGFEAALCRDASR